MSSRPSVDGLKSWSVDGEEPGVGHVVHVAAREPLASHDGHGCPEFKSSHPKAGLFAKLPGGRVTKSSPGSMAPPGVSQCAGFESRGSRTRHSKTHPASWITTTRPVWRTIGSEALGNAATPPKLPEQSVGVIERVELIAKTCDESGLSDEGCDRL